MTQLHAMGLYEATKLEIVEDWTFYYFPKQNGKAQKVSSRDSHLFVVGTLIRKGKNHRESLEKTLQELNDGKLNLDECLGNYSLIYFHQGHIRIYLDPSNIQNVFALKNQQAFSSSFLALKALLPKPTLNRLAATEALLTGSLIGPDTLLDEVKRVEPEEQVNIKALQIQHLPAQPFKGFFKGSYRDAVHSQIQTLYRYMEDTRLFANEQGVDSGITSGHDSRLMLLLMRKHWNNYQLHSHHRKLNNEEQNIAREVTMAAKLPLIQEPVNHFLDLVKDELKQNFGKAYYFCDGLIRMHGYWNEEYNTAAHRMTVLGNKQLGVSGIGGEQYRNNENLWLPRHDITKFIEYRLVKNVSGSSFQNKDAERELISYLEIKIRKRLNLNSSERKVSKLTLKRYFNEVFIPSRLGGRNNSENQISFFVSPFAEDRIAKSAYEIIPFLGPSQQFQQDMIKAIDPELAKIRSDNGFSFYAGEPLSHKIKGIVRDFIPYPIYQSRLDCLFRRPQHWVTEYIDRPFISELVWLVKELNLPVNMKSLLYRSDVMPLVLNLGYFIRNTI